MAKDWLEGIEEEYDREINLGVPYEAGVLTIPKLTVLPWRKMQLVVGHSSGPLWHEWPEAFPLNFYFQNQTWTKITKAKQVRGR